MGGGTSISQFTYGLAFFPVRRNWVGVALAQHETAARHPRYSIANHLLTLLSLLFFLFLLPHKATHKRALLQGQRRWRGPQRLVLAAEVQVRSLNGTATLAARWPMLPQKERCVKYKHPPRKPTWLSFYFIFPPPANIPHPIPLSPVPWKSNWFHDLRRHFATFCVSIARSTPVFLFLLSISINNLSLHKLYLFDSLIHCTILTSTERMREHSSVHSCTWVCRESRRKLLPKKKQRLPQKQRRRRRKKKLEKSKNIPKKKKLNTYI